MRISGQLLSILSLAFVWPHLAMAGANLASPATPAAGLLSATCADNAYWGDSSAGGACEVGPGLGARVITVTDYADAAADKVRIRKCVAGGTCTTVDVTGQTTVVRPTVTVASIGDCDDKVITVTTVDQNNVTNVVALAEETYWKQGTSEAVTAGKLCTSITGRVPGVTATLATATCILTKVASYKSVSVASSNSTCATVTNMTDAVFWASGSNATTARNLKAALDRLLAAGTLAGFTTASSNETFSDAKVGLIPSTTTTTLDVSLVNSNDHIFATVTQGKDGSVIVRNPAILAGSIRFCGNGPNGTTATYIGPLLPSDIVGAADIALSTAFGSTACDDKDNATEATADLPLHASFAFKPVSMVCTTNGGTDDTLTFSLRSAGAAGDTDLTCSVALAGAAVQCSAFDPSPTTIAAGATIAIKAVTNSNDNMTADDVECVVGFTY